MKIFAPCLTSIMLWAWGSLAAKDSPHSSAFRSKEVVPISVAREDRGAGWLYPEELTPMPQCIAQQDPSSWLKIMTESMENVCTRHFLFWCTRHEWRTQLNRLSLGFTPDVLADYLPYCNRSILAKAQLYNWMRSRGSRTWLVKAGDANDVQRLYPESLARGYAAAGVTHHAPPCLTESVSRASREQFHHVMASCSFTGTTQHTGRADRPWEYREDLGSMTALDFETVGYELTNGYIENGDYFDRDCFCKNFEFDHDTQYCGEPGDLEWTQKQLWINATCGPSLLPKNWIDSLRTLGRAYIPIKDWSWPACFADMPKNVTEHVHTCTVDACERDSSGYCNVKPAIDRARFCRGIQYDSCAGSCHIFEQRINYILWLHELCIHVPDWDGLPENWRRLTMPTTLDMTPWDWTIGRTSTVVNGTLTSDHCVSNEWKIGSIFIVHAVTYLAAVYIRRVQIRHVEHRLPWLSKGLSIAALQLGANYINTILVQQTPGNGDIPVVDLVLLWCSMPRLSWLLALLVGLLPQGTVNFSAAKSYLMAEVILQAASLYIMLPTIVYGLRHNFYFGGLKFANLPDSAKSMYFGALAWLAVFALAVFWVVQTIRRKYGVDEDQDYLPGAKDLKRTSSNLADNLDKLFAWLGNNLERHWMGKIDISGEQSPLIGENGGGKTTYGTLNGGTEFRRDSAKHYATAVVIMFLLWLSQCVFWMGFINLSSDEFCLPRLGLLTAVWTIASLVGTFIGAAI
ncbi:hypothetical protein DM02DRAFT_671393 [Periconia macrospinosa]|uniref:Uncharacterized protein n=1 Tax=Periconia macrospinosa TaxID=97972 RepID=A0A2V1DT94_9PLEO|nr:hypothetical protein DM02DRAFT_671393 [Periconia macrospinosa]